MSVQVLNPSEDESVIRQRLLTRTTVTRGEPPLKKLMRRFGAVITDFETGVDVGDCERSVRSFLQELYSFELPLTKSRAVIDANLRDQESFRELEQEQSKQIEQALASIEIHKVELEKAIAERKFKEECEVIRAKIALQPPRDTTEALIEELNGELVQLGDAYKAAATALELRRKQFSSLLAMMDKLVSNVDATMEREVGNAMGTSKTPALQRRGLPNDDMVVDKT